MDITAVPQLSPRSKVPTQVGVGVLVFVVAGALIAIGSRFVDQNLAPTPLIENNRGASASGQPCKVGTLCTGPTVSALDPEGEQLTYKFFDQVTGQPIGEPIKAESGKPITPEFKFDNPGDQQLYMVVEDGAGHTSKDYPIIIPVQ